MRRSLVPVDLNERDHDGLVRVGLEDLSGEPFEGMQLTVKDGELEAEANVARIDRAARLVFLAVDWESVRDELPRLADAWQHAAWTGKFVKNRPKQPAAKVSDLVAPMMDRSPS